MRARGCVSARTYCTLYLYGAGCHNFTTLHTPNREDEEGFEQLGSPQRCNWRLDSDLDIVLGVRADLDGPVGGEPLAVLLEKQPLFVPRVHDGKTNCESWHLSLGRLLHLLVNLAPPKSYAVSSRAHALHVIFRSAALRFPLSTLCTV